MGLRRLHYVKRKHLAVRRNPKNTLGLPDLDQAKYAVLNSLPSKRVAKRVSARNRGVHLLVLL